MKINGLFLIFIFSALGLIQTSILAKDTFGFPELVVPSDATELKILFINEPLWDGKSIVPTMRCTRLGGVKPASPELKIANVPATTKSLIIFFANPRSRDNHGLIRVLKTGAGEDWLIPTINSQASTKLPKGVELFDGGTLAGKAYAAPCPTGGNWQYTVTVYAMNETDNVVAIGKMNLGWVSV